MLPFERKSRILEYMDNGEVIYISDLAEVLGVSEITVRRDLKALEDEGHVIRLHGGGAKIIDTSRETKMDQRELLYPDEKEEIGRLAASLIDEGDVIFIDSGTTNVKMIKHIQVKDVTIVTNGFKTIEEAFKYNFKVTAVGGELKSETYAFVGAITSRVIEYYHFDKCFLGANGIHKVNGLSNADPNESLIKEMVVKRTHEPYVVADHSKFNATSVFKFGNIDDVTIITDKIPNDYMELDNIIIPK
ncbi:DeoR/GlpR family DNA-binding transcription regulator [Fundicoccus sp. Sow4_H7]|uniref:DeoR/GlpR family DNA-binding transcription regulator n=1 Tax=Fundicoccus sp. Sow4_H7 TaxID=3438784 RepID=UPI003F8F57B4